MHDDGSVSCKPLVDLVALREIICGGPLCQNHVAAARSFHRNFCTFRLLSGPFWAFFFLRIVWILGSNKNFIPTFQEETITTKRYPCVWHLLPQQPWCWLTNIGHEAPAGRPVALRHSWHLKSCEHGPSRKLSFKRVFRYRVEPYLCFAGNNGAEHASGSGSIVQFDAQTVRLGALFVKFLDPSTLFALGAFYENTDTKKHWRSRSDVYRVGLAC